MEEKAIVEVTVELDRESYMQYWTFSMSRWKRQYLMFFIAILGFFPLGMIGAFLSIVPNPSAEPGKAWLTGSSMLIFYVLLIFIPVYALFLRPKRAWRTIEQRKLTAQTFTFFEDQIQCQGGSQHIHGVEQIQYTLFDTVFETSHAFYLMFDKRSFILSKKYFSEAEAAALRELFTRQFGENFKTKGA